MIVTGEQLSLSRLAASMTARKKTVGKRPNVYGKEELRSTMYEVRRSRRCTRLSKSKTTRKSTPSKRSGDLGLDVGGLQRIFHASDS